MRHLIRDFTRAVLLGGTLLVTGISGISANAAGNATAPPESVPAPRLFASAQTQQALGPIVPYIAKWAGMDVLVVSKEDLKREDGYDHIKPSKAFESYTGRIDGFPFDRLEQEGLKGRLARKMSDASAHAFPIPARMEGDTPVCAISLPELEAPNIGRMISAVSDIDGTRAENIPGTEQEWLLLFIAHELAHCRHSYDDQRPFVALGFEREADQFAIDIYRKYADTFFGPIDDLSAVPAALIAFRGIAGMDSPHVHHSTSPGLHTGKTKPASIDRESLSVAKEKAQNAVWNMARYGMPDREKSARLSPQPHKMYKAARTLYEQGYFDDTPLQKRYIETFLDGAERFFPSYFKVSSYAAPQSPPAPSL